MRAGLIAATAVVIGSAWADVARAEPVTVWLTEQEPEERFLGRADRQTGGTLHLWTIDLRHPPQPVEPSDEAQVRAVLDAVEQGKEIWEEFEVEREIALSIDAAFDEITLLDDARDRQDLVRALLFEGAAVARAFDPELFPTTESAASLRFTHDGKAMPAAWVDAFALSGGKADRADLVDGTAWVHYQEVAKVLESLPKASLEVPEGIGDVFVDGRAVTPGIVELPPGRHFLHSVRGDVVHGRQVVDLAPGQASAWPSAVGAEDLAATRERVLAGKRSGMPDTLDLAAMRIAEHYDGQLYLAALDGNRVEIIAYAAGAALKDNQLVTVVLGAELGVGSLIAIGGDSATPIFTELNDGDVVDDPGATGLGFSATAAVDVEVGISYFVVAAGVDVHTTPGRTIAWGNGDENRYASVFANPWGGLGVYALRPTKRTATLAILGTAGWMSPGHAMYGGRILAGIPVDDHGNYFRIAVGGAFGPNTTWKDPIIDDKQPLATAWLRVGFGGRL